MMKYTQFLNMQSHGELNNFLMQTSILLKLAANPSFYKFIYAAGAEPSPLLLRPLIRSFYEPWMIKGDDYGTISGLNERQGKPKYSEKTCPNVVLSTTDAT
jgi:hypothetical protein